MDWKEKVFAALDAAGGKTGFFAKDLTTGETVARGAEQPLMAASVIKLPVLIECFAEMEEGTLDKEEEVTLKAEDKYPSCGALTYMHNGLKVTVEDLYTLMIILSDNTATNLLIDKVGMERVNARMDALGCPGTRLNRRLFDDEASARGIENYIVSAEIGSLLERLTRGEIVSPEASAEMLRILGCQRLNGKIPVLLPPGTKTAHKTGEDDGITHDVGVVFAPRPFVLCVCANEVDRGPFERTIQELAREVYDAWNGEEQQ